MSQARQEMLYNHQLILQERMNVIEQTALSVSRNNIVQKATGTHQKVSLYEFIQIQRTIAKVLNSFTYTNNFINSIQVYSDQFSEYEHIGQNENNKLLPLSKFPWRDEIENLKQADAMWIPSHLDEYSYYRDKTVLTYIFKMYNHKGETSGYVAVNFDESSLKSLLFSGDKDPLPHNRTLLVFDKEHNLLSKMSAADSANLAEMESLAKDIGETIGYQQVNINHKDFLMIFTTNNQPSGNLVEFIEVENINQDIQYVRNIILILGMVSLLLIIPLSSYLANKLIHPVASLQKGYQEIEKGNFSVKLEPYFIVEVNNLLHGFNHMTVRLKKIMEEIDKKNQLKRDLELRVLQNQINPHFLYNTLDMINWTAAMKGHNDISLMVTKLARLFRISLSGGKTFIPLQEELEHARLYMEIQQTRLNGNFTFSENISPILKHCYVPKVILQPFLENSIKHGFSVLNEAGEISIYGERIDSDTFKLMILDNGIGLHEEKENHPIQKNGYGIKNIRERLMLYFGKEFHVEIANREFQGVEVTIILPYIDSIEKLNEIQSKLEKR